MGRRIALAREKGLAGFADSVRERMFSAGYRTTDKPLFRQLMETFLTMSPHGYQALNSTR
jgi:hypothetical protein